MTEIFDNIKFDTDADLWVVYRKGMPNVEFLTKAAAEAFLQRLRDGRAISMPAPTPYPEFVASRFKSPEDTARDLALCTGQEAQLLHATVGMVGEWLEYKQSTSRENMLEELADFWFFYTAGAQVMGFDVDAAELPGSQGGVLFYSEACSEIEKGVTNLLDIAKRAAIYRKPLNLPSPYAYGLLCTLFRHVAEHHGFTIDDLETHNVAKLAKRYATGYSNEAAQARADKVE